jgi:hypothetical protein
MDEACTGCGRAAPAGGDPAWGAHFYNGRLVALACPDCLTSEQAGEAAARRDASVWQVASARRASSAELEGLADAGWLAQLAPQARAIGLRTGEEAAALDVLWVAHRPDGTPTAHRARIPLARWAALEEVYVAPAAQALAQRLAS